MPHSIDFHAAQIAWSSAYQEVAPGASASFDWTAKYPGVFMYHCGAAPVLMHIADGMYGMAIVDPKGGRPTAREYVIVQSEFYGSGGEYTKMLSDQPDCVAFNGQAFRYKTTPLVAKAGELVHLFLVNAGPNSSSAFHVIGAPSSHVEAEGNPANAQGMRQTIEVPGSPPARVAEGLPRWTSRPVKQGHRALGEAASLGHRPLVVDPGRDRPGAV
jgi:nitrite reductase (NO-forming)